MGRQVRRQRVRVFAVTTTPDFEERFAGPGMTLDLVIAEMQAKYREITEDDKEASDGDRSERLEDYAIWECSRLAAVMRDVREPMMQVVRFDRPA